MTATTATISDPRTSTEIADDNRVIRAALPSGATLLDSRPTVFSGQFVILAVIERREFTEFVCWYATKKGVSMGAYSDTLDGAQAEFVRRQSC